tara:strand:+ start:1243 stop:1392 length:150 start_codon:yes stop_codon:yes gene_type:complete
MNKKKEETLFFFVTVLLLMSLGLLKDLGSYSIPIVIIYPIWFIRVLRRG